MEDRGLGPVPDAWTEAPAPLPRGSWVLAQGTWDQKAWKLPLVK